MPGLADGAPTSARFRTVWDVFCHPDQCHLLVADVGNARVRAVAKDPRDCAPLTPPPPLPGEAHVPSVTLCPVRDTHHVAVLRSMHSSMTQRSSQQHSSQLVICSFLGRVVMLQHVAIYELHSCTSVTGAGFSAAH